MYSHLFFKKLKKKNNKRIYVYVEFLLNKMNRKTFIYKSKCTLFFAKRENISIYLYILYIWLNGSLFSDNEMNRTFLQFKPITYKLTLSILFVFRNTFYRHRSSHTLILKIVQCCTHWRNRFIFSLDIHIL